LKTLILYTTTILFDNLNHNRWKFCCSYCYKIIY